MIPSFAGILPSEGSFTAVSEGINISAASASNDAEKSQAQTPQVHQPAIRSIHHAPTAGIAQMQLRSLAAEIDGHGTIQSSFDTNEAPTHGHHPIA